MKPKNFPGRKEARRISALKRLKEILSKIDNQPKRLLTELEIYTLEGRITGDARSIRTKKFGSRKLGVAK